MSRKFCFIGICLSSLSACSSMQSVEFSVLSQANQCHIAAKEIIELSSEAERSELVKQLSLFKEAAVETQLTQTFTEHAKHEAIFLASQGKKATSGYGFNVHGDHATLNDGILTLPISLSSPPEGAFLAQVMTSPCLIFGVNRSITFNKVILDSLELELSQ